MLRVGCWWVAGGVPAKNPPIKSICAFKVLRLRGGLGGFFLLLKEKKKKERKKQIILRKGKTPLNPPNPPDPLHISRGYVVSSGGFSVNPPHWPALSGGVQW